MKQIHKDWLRRVADYACTHGCFPLKQDCGFQLHHSVGRTGRQNKVDIGHWFIIPVQVDYHDVNSNNPLNITHHRRKYTDAFMLESMQWLAMIRTIQQEDAGHLPFGEDVINAVLSTRR